MASRSYVPESVLPHDDETPDTLEMLTRAFDRPATEIVRQLITQAKPEDFPRSWQMAVDEQRQRGLKLGEGD